MANKAANLFRVNLRIANAQKMREEIYEMKKLYNDDGTYIKLNSNPK